MSEPDEPDDIGRGLDAIFADYFAPPTEMDLRGVDPATFALGLCYGFDSWQQVRVVANNRRNVAMAKQHWTEHHPSSEFLSQVAGTDERALGHRRLLERAHPACPMCEAQLRRLAPGDSDRVDPAAWPDDIGFEVEAWLFFQQVAATRDAEQSVAGTDEVSGLLHIPGQSGNHEISAEHSGGRDWQITIRDPSARRATVLVGWTDGQVTEHEVTFADDLAHIDAEALDEKARPEKVAVRITDPPGPP